MNKSITFLMLRLNQYRNRDYTEKLLSYIRAGAWVLLILFFAYVSLFLGLLQETSVFFGKYVEAQSSLIALIVNFGIVVLLVFDNTNDVFQSKSNRYACASFGLTIFIYGHAKNYAQGNSQELLIWLNTEYMAYLLVTVYFMIVTHIRYLSKKPNIEQRDIVAVKIQ